MTQFTRLFETCKRYLTLKTHKIYTLPIVILMPHSGCNCRCVMCDIWKNQEKDQQLTEAEIRTLLVSLQKLGTQWVVLSGGEALLNPKLFRLCEMLREAEMKITLLSTGLLLSRYAAEIIDYIDEVIVSLDGSEAIHDTIRQIPGAYRKLRHGVETIKKLKADFSISGRSVIQQKNFVQWPHIIEAAHKIGLDSISFLAADISTEAFHRSQNGNQNGAIQIEEVQLPHLRAILETLFQDYAADFESGYIVESPSKLNRIYDYYAAFYGLAEFPMIRCNAPWVSTVIEADGTVRPCFFQPAIGNIHQTPLSVLLNQPSAMTFRQKLDLNSDPICRKCVCSLNLRPTAKVASL